VTDYVFSSDLHLPCSNYLTYYMVMKKANIFEVKARLSEYIDMVSNGETIVIYRRNDPIAELRPVAVPRKEPRPLGGEVIAVAEDFFTPLPAAVEDDFYGGGNPGQGASTAAEKRGRYRSKKDRAK
jgi:antitoxin (DNA-binding transcriptional repressor) of toxin-antitoxin stability system